MTAITRAFEKFGKGLKRTFSPKNIERGFRRFGDTIVHGVLPVAERIAGGISTAAKYAAPILLASGVGAEFAPIALGVGAAAGATAKGIHTVRKLIKVAGQTKDLTERPSLEKGKIVASGALDIGSQFVPGGDFIRKGIRGVAGV
jgi:hypothetical protein